LLRNDPIRFANVVGSGTEDGSTAITLADHVNAQFDQSLSWKDIEWFRDAWEGPIVLKGIQTVEDAKIAATQQIDAIALSNHGGRQLDDAPTPLELIEPVIQSVNGEIEVYCDGGIRRGSDIVKAMALGATACMAGRPTFYGLGAAGQRGVGWVLDFLQDGMARTMALLGVRDVHDLGREHIDWK
jgi:L-lactate dehydrogenase (cytochrome)